MALPVSTPNSWWQGLDMPSRLWERDRTDFELFEEDDEFVLSVEMPGFDPDEITVSWDEGVLNIAAEHEDADRGHRKTYHRRFRFPKTVEEEDIAARYRNGVLEIHLPIETGAVVTGREIEIET